ncbi:MAG: GPW/gp25 family protein [Bacteroidota bacterium]
MSEEITNIDQNIPFLGRGWAFPVAFRRDGGVVEMVQDEEDIDQSLEILLTTAVRERVMQPRYGLDLRNMLFEPLAVTTAALLTRKVEKAILFFEPRIELQNIAYEQRTQEGMLIIKVDYLIIATNSRRNLVFPFYLTEGTDLP